MKYLYSILILILLSGCAAIRPMDLAQDAGSNVKVTDLAELGEAPASGDLATIVDVDDVSMAATGTNKKITMANLLGSIDGENIQNDTIDDDSLDFTDITLADFTDDVGFANEGANTDITSMTGLTTPLGPAYGGTGVANNAASTWTISGNYATTVTVTGITSITLPTSGTLLTAATLVGEDGVYGIAWDDDPSPPEKDDIYGVLHYYDTNDNKDLSDEDWFNDAIDIKLDVDGSASGLSGYSLGAQPVDEQLTDFADGTDSQVKEAKHSAPSIDYGEEVWADLDWDPLGRNVTTGSISTLTFHENGASADTITRSSGSFITDGFEDDMRIYVDTGNNAGFYTLNAVTDATTLTLISTDDLIDESTPSNVTIEGGWRYSVRKTQAGWVGLEDEKGNQLVSTVDMSSGTLIVPVGTADVAQASSGQMNFNSTDEQISFHSAADGEISGEVALSLIQHKSWAFDPVAVYSTTLHRLPLMTVGIDAPEGITIDKWAFSFDADPTAEIDADIMRADAFIGVANSAVVDALDTTNGASSEDTDANINGGEVIATTKVLYLEIDTSYTEAGHTCLLDIWFHYEED